MTKLKSLRPIMRESTKMFLRCFVFSGLAKIYRYPIDDKGVIRTQFSPLDLGAKIGDFVCM